MLGKPSTAEAAVHKTVNCFMNVRNGKPFLPASQPLVIRPGRPGSWVTSRPWPRSYLPSTAEAAVHKTVNCFMNVRNGKPFLPASQPLVIRPGRPGSWVTSRPWPRSYLPSICFLSASLKGNRCWANPALRKQQFIKQ